MYAMVCSTYHQLHVIFALNYNYMRLKCLDINQLYSHILKMTPHLQMLGPQKNHTARQKKWKGGDRPHCTCPCAILANSMLLHTNYNCMCSIECICQEFNPPKLTPIIIVII